MEFQTEPKNGLFLEEGKKSIGLENYERMDVDDSCCKEGDNGNALLERQSTTCSTHHMNRT